MTLQFHSKLEPLANPSFSHFSSLQETASVCLPELLFVVLPMRNALFAEGVPWLEGLQLQQH
jgi:hypothetical protein